MRTETQAIRLRQMSEQHAQPTTPLHPSPPVKGNCGEEALTDRKLILRFAKGRDQEAFRLLVERHGGLVFGVCRRILRKQHDAEDAFQATFLVLARKAGKVRWQQSLANWLYGVACRISLKSAAQNQRRQEQPMADEPSVSDCFDQIAAYDSGRTLHEELNHLPEKYRAPLVLCYLEGKTREQAAEELDCTLGTVKGRLERGRQELRLRLMRRGIGVALPAMAGGALLSTRTAEAATSLATVPTAPPAVPESLATSTVEAATTFAAGGSLSAAVTSQALTLAKGELAMMSSTPILKSATAVAVALMLIGVSYLMVAGDASAQKIQNVPQVNSQIGAEPGGGQPPGIPVAAIDQPDRPEPGESDLFTSGTQSMFLVGSRKNNVVSVFSKHTGRWHKQSFQLAPGEKVEPTLADEIVVVQAGTRVYGFSALAGKWHWFEIPDGTSASPPIVHHNWAMVQVGDTRYAFSAVAPEPKWVPAELGEPSGRPERQINDQAPAERLRLQGTWTPAEPIEAWYEGSDAGKAELPEVTVTIAEDSFVLWDTARVEAVFTFKLNPAVKPKQIDLVSEGDDEIILRGIYQLQGDELKLMLRKGDGPRPQQFVSIPESDMELLVLERQHPEPKRPTAP